MDSNKLLQMATAGDCAAQLELSSCYYFGKNQFAKDSCSALCWAQKAAAQGSPAACFQLAFFYQNGIGCELNHVQAMRFYEKAAFAGNAKAQFNLAVMHLNGACECSDLSVGLDWLEKAAEQDFVSAQLLLGKLYTSPTPNKKMMMDFSKGAQWFERAANHGDAEAQLLIGSMYLDGKGVERDVDKARFWVSRSADQGNFQAFFALRMIDQMSNMPHDLVHI